MRPKGFTIIEFMIVVAILVIMTLIAVPMYQNRREQSRNDAVRTVLRAASLAETARWKESLDAGRAAPDDGFVYVTAAGDIEAVAKLAAYGFRVDANVGVAILKPKAGGGFVALAAHRAAGSPLYICDSLGGAEPEPYDQGKAYTVAPEDLPSVLPLFAAAGEMEIDHDDNPDTPPLNVAGAEPGGGLVLNMTTGRVTGLETP